MPGDPSRRFTPMMSNLLLSSAAKMKMSNRGVPGAPFDELVSSERHLMELGKCFFQTRAPGKAPRKEPRGNSTRTFKVAWKVGQDC